MQTNQKRTIDEIESSLEKMEGRHLRLLNRLATKNLKEKIVDPSSKKNVNKKLKEQFFLEKSPLYSGVVSAIYSKLNGDIKDTLFSGANLGLVIEKNDVKTNYNLVNLDNFMTFAGTYDSRIFDKGRFFKRKIKNSTILKNSFNRNSSIAEGSTNKYSQIAEGSTNTNSSIAYGSTNTNSRIAGDSTNKYSQIGYKSRNINSFLGEKAKLEKQSNLGLEAKVRNCEIGKDAEKDSSSSIGKGIKYI